MVVVIYYMESNWFLPFTQSVQFLKSNNEKSALPLNLMVITDQNGNMGGLFLSSKQS